MKFKIFSQYLSQLEAINSRLDMTAMLAELLLELDSQEIPPACYLMQGSLVPSYQSLEFNMGLKLTMRSLAKLLNNLNQSDFLPSTNLFQEQDDTAYLNLIKDKNKELGDLGLAIEELLSETKLDPSNLSLLEVHEQLVAIAEKGGEGSQDYKINKTEELLAQLNPTSIKFVVRIIIGKLRLGFSTMTIIDALSWARLESKNDSKKIEAAYQKKADIGKLAQGYLQCESDSQVEKFINNYQLEVGIPVLPALCQRLNTAQEIIDKMEQVIMEPKYDGLRTQIHINKKNKEQPYQVFTRNLDDVSYMFPELKEALSSIKAKICILDAEAIAYHPETGELLSFQETITRKRKHGISSQSEQVPIKFYLFDVLFLEGKSLIDTSLLTRKEQLKEIISPNDIISLVDYKITQDEAEVREYHQQQLNRNLEGAVIKKVDAPYRAGRKGWRWVKIKETEGSQGKLSDTLDCVVMGYYRGKGKRAQFGMGAFLVGVLTEDGQIKTIAKIGTGLTDEQFKYIKNLADEHKTKSKPDQYDVPEDLEPDVWVEPEIVAEIAADELTDSPIHTAGKALRFPRLVEFRDDKDWEQATQISELEQIKIG